MAKSANKGKLIAFHVPPEFFDELEARAHQFGFQSAALMCRAVVELHTGKSEVQIALTRVGAVQLKLQRKAMRVIAATLANMTEEDLLGD